jgi:phage tail sheath protein FI
MPEYLAPGVFVEEVSFRNKTIEGVGTSIAGFIGPTRYGPLSGEPELLTSFADFERIYGGIDQLEFTERGNPTHNYVAHAVRAFYEEGGNKLFVSRVYRQAGGHDNEGIAATTLEHQGADVSPITGLVLQGIGSPIAGLRLRARYPGRAGNFRIEMVLRAGENILDIEPFDPVDVGPDPEGRPVLRGASNYDTVIGFDDGSPPVGTAYQVQREIDENGLTVYRLFDADGTETELDEVTRVHRISVGVVVVPTGRFEDPQAWEGLTLDPEHRNSLSRYFAAQPSSRSAALTMPLVIEGADAQNGAAIAEVLLTQPSLRDGTPVGASLFDDRVGDNARTLAVRLSGGSDGERPRARDYQGDESSIQADGEIRVEKSGLLAFEDVEEIFSVAAPGATFGLINGYGNDAQAIIRLLISHCERMRYRVAILDSGDSQALSEVRALRSGIDSTRAALYYPWVKILDPVTEDEINLPPSGFMAGIFARNDIRFGVHKAPANEVVRLATSFETVLNKAQQETLNPEGVNCLRFFEGRGYRVWGARTASSDPEWKYLNVRRYFHFLESSIDRGTQWAVFENNGPELWANVRSTIEDFLYNEFRSGHLLGTKPAEAYFVRCDRSTMTQNDLDNGRLICLIGVSPLRPAEFVVFRIGQKTADARS